jgi:predicted Co/Zn/Cd cation transporter (cation efflux family)
VPDVVTRERSLLLASAVITLGTAVAGVGVGLFATSGAIVFDGMYALIDAGMALAAWLVAGLIGRGEDRRFQFGYWHLEPMLGFLSGALGLLASVYAVADAVGGLLAGGRVVSHNIGAAFTLGSAVVSVAAFLYLRHRGRGLNSMLLSMEARAWLHSGIMSAVLSLSFGIAIALQATGRGTLAAYADPAALLVLSLALSPYPVRRMIGSGREILQIAPPELDARVASVIRGVAERHGFTGHRSYVTRVGRAQFVEVGFVAPSCSAATTFGALDLVRKEVADAIGGLAPSCWLTVDFTADPRWL